MVAINQGRDLRRALPLIKARVAVDPARLADPAVDLRTLGPASSAARRGHEEPRMIKRFSTLYIGHIELENCGHAGTPADDRRYRTSG